MEKVDPFEGSGGRAMDANLVARAELQQRIQQLLNTGGSTAEINKLRARLEALKQDRGLILDADLPK
ncbi:MAG: hypothetical protein WCT44_00845 [Candidatus Paceibacterota bacterium]